MRLEGLGQLEKSTSRLLNKFALIFSGFFGSRENQNESPGREIFPSEFQNTEGTKLAYLLYILCPSKVV
jgi:hypothetical protein